MNTSSTWTPFLLGALVSVSLCLWQTHKELARLKASAGPATQCVVQPKASHATDQKLDHVAPYRPGPEKRPAVPGRPKTAVLESAEFQVALQAPEQVA